MSSLDAIILGIIQGLTEFIPVSSDGHLKLGESLLGVGQEKSLAFTMIIHAATSLSAIIVFRKTISKVIAGIFEFKWNEELQFALKILISMVPVGIVGVFFEDEVESLFQGDLSLTGFMFILTGSILFIPYFFKKGNREVGWIDSVCIGIAQAAAVLPGLSRSGSTIVTGLVLGVDRTKMAHFSFLMVIPPILGKTFLDLKDMISPEPGRVQVAEPPASAMILGFLVAFIIGLFACSAMIGLVKNEKIWWFGSYCIVLGLLVLSFTKGWF